MNSLLWAPASEAPGGLWLTVIAPFSRGCSPASLAWVFGLQGTAISKVFALGCCSMCPQGCLFRALSTLWAKATRLYNLANSLPHCILAKWDFLCLFFFYFFHNGVYNQNIHLQNLEPWYLHSKDHICQSLTTNGSKIVAPRVFEERSIRSNHYQ